MTVDQLVYSYVAKEETYPDAKVIFQEGSKSTWVYIILEGTVKIKKKTPRGQVTLATLKQGNFLGEMAFLATGEGVHSASAVAAEGPVRLGLLDTHQLVRDYEAVSPRFKNLLRSLIKMLQAANGKVCDIVIEAQ